MIKRGVYRISRLNPDQTERVCDCRCHVEPGTMHMINCCSEPKTEDGKKALDQYNDTHR